MCQELCWASGPALRGTWQGRDGDDGFVAAQTQEQTISPVASSVAGAHL